MNTMQGRISREEVYEQIDIIEERVQEMTARDILRMIDDHGVSCDWSPEYTAAVIDVLYLIKKEYNI